MTRGHFGPGGPSAGDPDEERNSPDDGYVADDQAVLEGDVPAQG